MQVRPLLLSAAATLAAAVAGNLATAEAVSSEWYRSLTKPPWQPPAAVFGPVWTFLYVLIAISGASLWSSGRTQKSWLPKALFVMQMLLNASWSPVFFGARSLGGGLLVIITLWATIAGYVATVPKTSRVAAWLFLPYFLWVSFAAVLNAWIWANNRGQ